MKALRLRAVLAADVGLSVLLVSLCLDLFVVYPFVPLSGRGKLLVTLGLTAILISGSFSLGDRPNLRIFVVGLAVVTLAFQWLGNLAPSNAVLAGTCRGRMRLMAFRSRRQVPEMTSAGCS